MTFALKYSGKKIEARWTIWQNIALCNLLKLDDKSHGGLLYYCVCCVCVWESSRIVKAIGPSLSPSCPPVQLFHASWRLALQWAGHTRRMLQGPWGLAKFLVGLGTHRKGWAAPLNQGDFVRCHPTPLCHPCCVFRSSFLLKPERNLMPPFVFSTPPAIQTRRSP